MDLKSLYIREFERNDGNILNISQSELGDVGCVVWDAALVLAKYLETGHFENETLHHFKNYINTLKVDKETNSDKTGTFVSAFSYLLNNLSTIELGSGTGIVGIQAACMGANCTITDLRELWPLMNDNIKRNRKFIKGTIQAKVLKWNHDLSKWKGTADIILIADCVYYEQSIEDLIATIETISKPNSIVICSYEDRTIGNKEEMQNKFFELLSQTFQVSEIDNKYHDAIFRSDDIHIHKFIKILQ